MAHGEQLSDLFEADRVGEACGLIGVYSDNPNIVEKVYDGMFTLQHRGQTAAGIAVFKGDELIIEKDNGLVQEALTGQKLRTLEFNRTGYAVIGHDRYSTSGKEEKDDNARLAQPFGGKSETFALGHNGHIEDIGKVAGSMGIDVGGCESDSECLTYMLDEVKAQRGDLVEALHVVLPKLEGAFNLVINESDRLIGVRDPRGYRPLCVGRLKDGGYILASETIALVALEAELIKEVDNGEMIIIDKDGMRSEMLNKKVPESLCLFEYIYFSHPGSMLRGKNLKLIRKQLGQALGEDHPVDADLVIGIQNSGSPYGRGYANPTGIEEDEAINKNDYIHRTFINSVQMTREELVRLKHQPNRSMIEGKRVVLVDDSIVRGTTMRTLVKMTRESGATEVHLRIASPPYISSCYYGVETREPSELIAYGRTVQEMCEYLGADSLEFLDLDRIIEIIEPKGGREVSGKYMGSLCVSCMTGEYPTPVPVTIRQKELEHQKELLKVG